MKYDILNSVNKKDRQYKLLLKTDVNSYKYAALKATFKQYKETLRRSINPGTPEYRILIKNIFCDLFVTIYI